MEYASSLAAGYAGEIGLVIFFVFFTTAIAWVFRPGSKDQYARDAAIPFRDEHDE